MPFAKVILEKRTVNNEPRKVGDIVEVCENTLRNLIKKGVLEPAEAPEPKAKAKAKEKDAEK